jgi:exonuclease SbcD
MGKSREDEHQAFFVWLLQIIESNNITLLIVAGDIFDTTTPPNYALELYYNFLKKLSNIEELTTVIVAGNHDSIATLTTSKQLLELLNVHVITKGEKEENQLIPVYQKSQLKAFVCAIPFLRDTLLRKTVSAEAIKEREMLINHGIKRHYKGLYQEALKMLDKLGFSPKEIPLIATGHLTAIGARSSESERDIYIGGTVNISGDFLGKYFDYVALGHMHLNQRVGSSSHVCYSGSPIALSFAEANSVKKVNIVEFFESEKNIEVSTLEIPTYRPLHLLKGNLEQILEWLRGIENKQTWIEIQLTDDDNPFASNQTIRSLAEELGLILLAVKIDRSKKSLKAKDMRVISLTDLGVNEVFEKRLEMENMESESFEKEVLKTFKSLLNKVESQ